jgi:GH15 family glucan-1,4-alpha-glucosidase
MTRAIGDYALIGDCETAALVGRDGSIDWLCWPRFDSAACFAALVGSNDNGRWSLAATDPHARVSRRYRKHTLILETSIETATGAVIVIDFMPIRGDASDVVRLVRGVRGQVAMRTELAVRFDYGSATPRIDRFDHETLIATAGADMVALRTPVRLNDVGPGTTGEFTISADQTVPFVLTYSSSHLAPPRPIDPMTALAETEAFWCGWAGGTQSAGEWSEPVIRSLITLKALTYKPTGAIAAAPTTSLPEKLGGKRNWDYRYCWLRDATFTLITLMNAGFYDDARAWRSWLLRAVADGPDHAQIMYGMSGERRLPEREIPWLSGFEDSRPVRVGNAAYKQMQIDVYGEVIDALHHGRVGDLDNDEAAWQLQTEFLAHLESLWREPDHGIWETRGNKQQFTNSKVMAWVAFDRGIKSIENFGNCGPLERWRGMRDTIHKEVCRHGFNNELGAFVQTYGSKELDASALLVPLVGFLPVEDPRVHSTVEAVMRHLLVDGLVRRYDTDAGMDGLPPGEGIFIPCSFWLADNLILLGRREEARQLLQRLLSLCNDVGLLSEEYDPKAGELLGNFPQAFSHVALINTVYLFTSQGKHKRHVTGH